VRRYHPGTSLATSIAVKSLPGLIQPDGWAQSITLRPSDFRVIAADVPAGAQALVQIPDVIQRSTGILIQLDPNSGPSTPTVR